MIPVIKKKRLKHEMKTFWSRIPRFPHALTVYFVRLQSSSKRYVLKHPQIVGYCTVYWCSDHHGYFSIFSQLFQVYLLEARSNVNNEWQLYRHHEFSFTFLETVGFLLFSLTNTSGTISYHCQTISPILESPTSSFVGWSCRGELLSLRSVIPFYAQL